MMKAEQMENGFSINIYAAPLRENIREEYLALLDSAGLTDEGDADIIAIARDARGRAAGCGCLAGHTLKQFAVAPSAEGTGIMAAVMTELMAEAYRSGITRLFLCTKPSNKKMFSSLGFHILAETGDAVLMENRKNGIERYLSSVRSDAEEHLSGSSNVREGPVGAVVCNCDPFTLGHRALIEYAARQCSFLYIFAVSEKGSMFSPDERLRMIREGTEDIGNARVYASELYLVSRATFPAYFIRDEADAENVRSDIDIALFAQRIAPALGITKRFVGEEPFSPVTRSYNERMKQILPLHGIDLIKIPRFSVQRGSSITNTAPADDRSSKSEAGPSVCPRDDAGNVFSGEAVSAGIVRSLIRNGRYEDVRNLVPASTYRMICSKLCPAE